MNKDIEHSPKSSGLPEIRVPVKKYHVADVKNITIFSDFKTLYGSLRDNFFTIYLPSD